MKKDVVIKIQKLKKSFDIGDRRNTVLKDIDLEIYEGEILTIFGPSGCGKSTLLNTVMGIEKPDSGTLQVFGIDLWKMNSDDRADVRKRNIGVVYQQQNWIKSLTVVENVALSAQLLGFNKEEALEKAKKVIEEVGMSRYEDFYTTELSSGEQQKIGLARSLISDPKVIIADEPTGNLDTDSGFEVLKILRDLTESGKTIVLVTHNPEYLKDSDRVAIMKNGNIVEVVNSTSNIRKTVEEKIRNAEVKNGISVISADTDSERGTTEESDFVKESLLQKLSMYISFVLRFFVYSTFLLIEYLVSKISPKKVGSFRNKFSSKIHKLENGDRISKNINSLELTEISFKNLFFKRFRAIVTILGVAMGTGFVVLLLSLGYGVERLVVEQITEAQDLNQIDVFPKVGSQLNLNDELISKLEEISGVNEIYKIRNIPGRIEYQGSIVDVVVYGIEEGYLESSPFNKISGEYLSSDSDMYDALVNTEYLRILGLDEDVLEDKFTLKVIPSDPNIEIERGVLDVRIVGVIEDDSPQVLYLMGESIQEYSGENYSQATIVINQESSLDEIRKQIEALGLETFSVMDTIDQVQEVFGYLRIGLLFFGTLSFGIAFLGMVNTLMVSLLERTREVGLVKIIGMKRDEVRLLFITESMFIGFLGGLLGIFVGFLLGNFVSLIIYTISLSRGVDFVHLSYFPVYLSVLVVVCMTLLGFFTGLYPANRAVKIPPLDALRYE